MVAERTEIEQTYQEIALDYARNNWHVFPLKPRTKEPLSIFQFQQGFKNATVSTQRIQQAWRKEPTANIGIATGKKSGIVVLDIDPDGIPWYEESRNKIPATRTAKGGRVGYHLYFRHPGGDIRIPCSTEKIAPGVDVRGDGGYIVAPPSLHPNGTRYEWIDECNPAPLPDWLAALMVAPKARKSKTTASNDVPASHGGTPDEEARYWLDHYASQAEKGNRDDTCFLLACQLRDSARLSEEAAAPYMREYARRVPQPDGDLFTEEDAIKKLRSAYTQPAREPASHAKTAVPRTDMGNAARLVQRHGHDLRYCYELKKWLYFDGKRWRIDTGAAVERLAKDTVRHIADGASEIADNDERTAMLKWAAASQNATRISAMIQLARSELAIRLDALDSDPWLFNVQNGTLDLRTGELRPHNRGDFITRISPVSYDEYALCPLWDAFLNRVQAGNAHLISYLQKAAGYSLTGDTREQCFFILFGWGANGKSVFLAPLAYIIGDYGRSTRPETFMVKRTDNSANNDVAALAGARFVTAHETEEGRRLAEAFIKQATAGDPITARFLHGEYFTYIPVFKLWMAANHKPVIRGADDGIWRRPKLIPFTVTIPRNEQDKTLHEKLRAEAAGILAWMVRGCLAWQREGLDDVQPLQDAVQDYREEQDMLREFLEEYCAIEPQAFADWKSLWNSYATYTEYKSMLSETQFRERMRMRDGFKAGKGAKGMRGVRGVRLLTPQELDERARAAAMAISADEEEVLTAKSKMAADWQKREILRD